MEVQARGESNGSPPALESNSVVNASRPSSTQTSRQPLILSQSMGKATASTTALSSTSSTASITKHPEATEQGTTVATNPIATGSGETGGFIPCGAERKRSRTIKGRRAAHLQVRIQCLAPGALQPATALVPDSNPVSKAEKKPQPTSSPEPQATESSQQASSKPTDFQQAGSQQTESQQMNSQQPNSEQTDSEQKDTEQKGSQQTKSHQADTQQTDSQQTDSQHTDNQPAKDTSHGEPEDATPNVASVPIGSAIIVQGQIVPANGEPITVNNQPVFLSSGYIHVGSSSTPIPKAQVTPPAAQPIVAGTLTFHPASPSPVAQVAPSPFVVGGFTFSVAQPAPSTESDTKPNHSPARPVVVGGTIYTPIEPSTGSKTLQEAGQQPEQGGSESSKSPDQPKNAVGNDSGASDEANSQTAQADSKSIVIGGITYTPVTTTATPSPQRPAIFSFSGTTLTQGGAAVTISGTRISLGPSGVLIGTSSLPIATAAAPPTSSLLTVNFQTLTALPGSEQGFELAHSTLLPGSPGITLSGTLYSLNTAGSLIVGPSTIPLATANSNSNGAALTAAGETFTPLGSTAVVVNGTTLSLGGPAITDDHGIRLSLASNGIVIGSSTFAYATPVVVDTATVSGSSEAFSTGVVSPSGGASPAAIPSATGGVYRSTASAKRSVSRMMMAITGISVSLYVMIRIL